MKVLDFSQLANANHTDEPTVVTVGVFDGVHLGHRYFLSRLLERAHEANARSAVVTFWPHPRNVFRPDAPVPSLTSLQERIDALHGLGIHDVIALRFDADLASVTADDFVAALKGSLGMTGLVVGHDFALGRGRQGTPAVLGDIGRRLGFWVEEMPALELGSAVVSSSAIRDAIVRGDVTSAAGYLGRPFSIDAASIPVAADENSVDIQVPPPQLVPDSGVYRTTAWIDAQPYASRTRVDGPQRWLRVHLPRLRRAISASLRLQFLEKLDGETSAGSTAMAVV